MTPKAKTKTTICFTFINSQIKWMHTALNCVIYRPTVIIKGYGWLLCTNCISLACPFNILNLCVNYKHTELKMKDFNIRQCYV